MSKNKKVILSGDRVKIVRNINNKFYDFLIGTEGTVTDIGENIGSSTIVADCDQKEYLCHNSELIKLT